MINLKNLRNIIIPVVITVILILLTELLFKSLLFRHYSDLIQTKKVNEDYYSLDVDKIKLSDEKFNIFIYGGSSIAFAKDFFSKVKAFTQNNISVYNFGVDGSSSTGIRKIIGETIGLRPDLIIVYAGHNDYWLNIESLAPPFSIESKISMVIYKYSYTYRYFLYKSIKSNFRNKAKLNTIFQELKCESVHQNAIKLFICQSCDPPDDFKVCATNKLQEAIIEQLEQKAIRTFQSNMEQAIEIAKEKRVPMLFITPVSHPYIYENYISYIKDDKSLSEFKEKVYEVSQKVKNLNDEDLGEKLLALEKKYPRNGLISAFLARHYDRIGNFKKKRYYELQIIEQNMRSHKAKKQLNKTIQNLEDKQNKIYVLDFYNHFYFTLARHESFDSYFKDYVHPTYYLYDAFAKQIVSKLTEEGLLAHQLSY